MTANEMQTHLKAWGEYKVLAPLEGGFRNTAFLVEAHNTKRVAKTTRRSEAAMRWLQPVHAAAQQAGFVTPDLIASTNGKLVVNGVTLETFIEGHAPTSQALLEMQPSIETFHDLTRGFPQRPGFASSIELLHETSGGDVDLNAMPNELVTLCREHWRERASNAQSVVHGDLNANNILITNDGQYGLVDWDETRVDISDFDTQALMRTSGTALDSRSTTWLDAWEVAVCWQVEPAYALEVAKRFQTSSEELKGTS
jgi:Ser/Thr protein kinase RdoA (MazF antagonist)